MAGILSAVGERVPLGCVWQRAAVQTQRDLVNRNILKLTCTFVSFVSLFNTAVLMLDDPSSDSLEPFLGQTFLSVA
jgi:hypothetical protein